MPRTDPSLKNLAADHLLCLGETYLTDPHNAVLKTVWSARYRDLRTTDEIAVELGVSPRSVQRWLSQARNIIRQRIQEETRAGAKPLGPVSVLTYQDTSGDVITAQDRTLAAAIKQLSKKH